MVCQGTWKATGFTSFTGFGANVTHYCKTMGMTMTGIPMTVTSTIDRERPGRLHRGHHGM